MKGWREWRSILALCYTLIIIHFSLIDLKPLGTNLVGEFFIEIHSVGEGFVTHLIAYFFMGYLWRSSGLSFIKSFLICFLTGFMIEIAQGFTSTRFFSLFDNFANGLGSLLGIILHLYINYCRSGFGKMRRLNI